jgi:hypothetical protein
MDLANMRHNGVRSLLVTCYGCQHGRRRRAAELEETEETEEVTRETLSGVLWRSLGPRIPRTAKAVNGPVGNSFPPLNGCPPAQVSLTRMKFTPCTRLRTIGPTCDGAQSRPGTVAFDQAKANPEQRS